jgi:uncharacterized coiled-coil protein SlyX
MVTFRIVTDDEVLSALVDSQRTMREQLRQIIALQMEVRDRCRTAIDHTVKETTLGLAHHEVVKCADAEQQVKDQLAATTERLEQLLDRIRNNRIVAQADERRMQTSVIAPLKKAQIDYVAHLTEQFQAAKAIRDGEPLATRLQETIAVQDDLINLLEAIVAEMIKVENAQQVERGLRTIIKLSDKVRSIVRAPGGDEAPETGKPAPENGGAGREDTP